MTLSGTMVSAARSVTGSGGLNWGHAGVTVVAALGGADAGAGVVMVVAVVVMVAPLARLPLAIVVAGRACPTEVGKKRSQNRRLIHCSTELEVVSQSTPSQRAVRGRLSRLGRRMGHRRFGMGRCRYVCW